MCYPDIKELVAQMGQQPDTDTLTAGKKANQELFEQMLELYNCDEVYEGDLALDKDPGIQHYFPDSLDSTLVPGIFNKVQTWEQMRSMVKKICSEFNELRLKWK